MSHYIWENQNWTDFTWDDRSLTPLLSRVRLKQGKLLGKLSNLLEIDTTQAWAVSLTEETVKTAAIEGEKYDPSAVRSSINRRLGLGYAGLSVPSHQIEGLVNVLIDATTNYKLSLSKKRLLSWHASLFPHGYSGLSKIKVGQFRDDKNEPMQVVSGPIGYHKVHYQAPPAKDIDSLIQEFLFWWKQSEGKIDGIIRAGIAHFYFVTIHPFEDGNGRLARALTDMALTQDDHLSKRYISLSSTIEKNKKSYYEILESTQKNGNLSSWLSWFLSCFEQALNNSGKLLENIFVKAEFWHKHKDKQLNSRQIKVINKLLDVENLEFLGGLTTRKYLGITHSTSRRTAIRDINYLLEKGILNLRSSGGGRNISYRLAL